MAKSLNKRGALPNGRPDRETMQFRYSMLKELQRQVTPDVMAKIVGRAISDAITGDEKVVAQARNFIAAYTLPKVEKLSSPEDIAQSNTQINTFVLNASTELLEQIASGFSIETVEADVQDAISSPG